MCASQVSSWLPQALVGAALAEAEHVIEFTADGVGLDGAAMPFPPLHVHHIHLVRARRETLPMPTSLLCRMRIVDC